ncbi:MAG: hypothetical protein B1H04_02150 [Planctomycetales bacterium 4484_123]|nr:MAG: hypothetical protein B1H04_02150 [Planctomycetales bacterium 4484_123]
MNPRGEAIGRLLRRLGRQEAGQLTLEWAMVLAFIALPMYFVMKVCMRLLVAHYRMVSFMETVPFP